MKVLITGSEGLMGRPMARMLEQRGDQVARYDLVLGKDVFDEACLQAEIAAADVDAVIHLAAQSGVPQARTMAKKAWDLNFGGTLNILEACRLANKPVVVASSNHIYGNHGGQLTDENALQLALDTYSATKIALDVAARSYAKDYGLRVAIMRNTNCFGPDSPHFDHIIEGTIRSYLKGEPPVIWTDGQVVKSYMYVDDTVEAYIAVLDWLLAGGNAGEAFNVTGERISVLALVQLIGELMGASIKPVVEGRPGITVHENMDDRKVRHLTGWRPRHRLREALVLTIEGMRQRLAVPV